MPEHAPTPADTTIFEGIVEIFDKMRRSGIRIGVPSDEAEADKCFRAFITEVHTGEGGEIAGGPDEADLQRWSRKLTDMARSSENADLYSLSDAKTGFLAGLPSAVLVSAGVMFTVFGTFSGWFAVTNRQWGMGMLSGVLAFVVVMIGFEIAGRLMTQEDEE